MDGCSDRFGSNKANCTASIGLCLWVETDGEGKCVMSARPNEGDKVKGDKKDGCFARFGSNKANCTASNDHCRWVETYGEGKCVMSAKPDRGGKGKGGGRLKEGSKKATGSRMRSADPPQKVVGVLAISISSSLSSVDMLQTLNQHLHLLEHAVAHSHGYTKVRVLSVDPARRLRETISTQIRIRFEAEGGNISSSLVGGPATHLQAELEKALLQSFEKAGLDFNVESATVVITSAEGPASSPQGDKRLGFSKVGIALTGGIVLFCTCTAMLCMWRRRCTRKATFGDKAVANNLVVAPVVGVVMKEKDLSEIDFDLASVSTGAPSTHDDISEP